MTGPGEKAGGGGGAERRKYPIHVEDYELYEEIGQGVSALVYRALCKPLDEIVAVKVLDFERTNSDLVRATPFPSILFVLFSRSHPSRSLGVGDAALVSPNEHDLELSI